MGLGNLEYAACYKYAVPIGTEKIRAIRVIRLNLRFSPGSAA
jgi:hypothetical protein